MQVFVPYTQLHAETQDALQPYNPTYLPMLQDGDYPAYWAQRWVEHLPFINVEHDVVPTNEQIKGLVDCPYDWCAFAYLPDEVWGTNGNAYMGLMKVNPPLIDAIPTVWDSKRAGWGNCDVHLSNAAAKVGIFVHQHFPSVRHLKGE